MAKKVSKGQPVRGNLSAGFFNDTNKLLREWRASGETGGGQLPDVVQQRSVVWVKSTGGTSHDPIDAGGIVQLYQNPSSEVAANRRTWKEGNPTTLLREPILPVEVPNWSGSSLSNVRTRRFFVLIDRLQYEGVARAVVQGPTYAKVKLHSQLAFRYAQIVADESGHLEQSPTGYAEIIAREEGVAGDVVDALILIAGEPTSLFVTAAEASSGSTSTAYKFWVKATTNPASNTDFFLSAINTTGVPYSSGQGMVAHYRQNQTATQPGLWIVAPFITSIPE